MQNSPKSETRLLLTLDECIDTLRDAGKEVANLPVKDPQDLQEAFSLLAESTAILLESLETELDLA